jgi:hypothetical protein
MTETTTAFNPFMLMIEPEVVLAAVEKSERLGQLNRHLCRPLDRPLLNPAAKAEGDDEIEADAF